MPRPFAVIGYTLFVTLAVVFQGGSTLAWVLLCLSLLVFAVVYFWKRLRSAVYIAAALTVVAGSTLFLLAETYQYQPGQSLAGQTIQIEANITALPRRQYGRVYYEVTTSKINGSAQKLKLRLSLKDALDAEPMDTVSGEVTVFSLGERQESSLDLYKSNGLYLGAYTSWQGELQVTPHTGWSPRYAVLQLRQGILNSIDTRLPNVYGGLAKALLLGDKTGLPYGTRQHFSDIGISHVVAVSGLHLSIWALFFFQLCEHLGVKRRFSALISIAFILLFMALAGFTYSVTRSGLMMLVMMVGYVFSREADSFNSLGIGMLLICLIEPFSAGNVGLQLSFLATLGILLFAGKLERAVSMRIKGWKAPLQKISLALWRIGSTSIAATLTTLPLLILVFGKVPLLSIFANILILSPASLCMLLTGFSALFVPGSFLGVLGDGLAACVGLLARYILWMSEKLAAISFATIQANTTPMYLFVAGFLLLLAAMLFFLRSSGKSKQRLVALLSAAVFAGAILVNYAFSAQRTVLTVVDSGNCLSVVLSQGRNAAVIANGSGDFYYTQNIVRALEQEQAKHLNLLLLPQNAREDNESAVELAKDFRPDAVYAAAGISPLDLVVSRQRIAVAQQQDIALWGNTQISYLSNEAISCIYIVTYDTTVLLLCSPMGDLSQIPTRWLQADLFICRGTPPPGLDYSQFGYVVVSAQEDRGVRVQNALIAGGISATATAENGDLRFSLGAGAVSAQRIVR